MKIRGILFLTIFISIFCAGSIKNAEESVVAEKYIVKEGDTLWTIGKNIYKLVYISDLRNFVNKCLALNPSIKNENHIFYGQRILLPKDKDVDIESVSKSVKLNNGKSSFKAISLDIKDKTPEEIDKILSALEGYDLVKGPELEIKMGRYNLKFDADRLLTPKDTTSDNKPEYFINYIRSPKEATSASLKTVLDEKGINLIETVVK